MATFQEWLDSDNAARCTLVKVSNPWYGSVTDSPAVGEAGNYIYFSNRNYIADSVGKGTDIPAHQAFLPIITNSVAFTESISIDGSASISYGDLELDNTDGAADILFNYIFANRKIEVFFGDINDTTANFQKIFTGTISDISSSSNSSVNLGIRDILQRLNMPIYDKLLGGVAGTDPLLLSYGTKGTDNPNKAVLRPLCFGEVHNITPLLSDDSILEYMVHDGPIEGIIEVRDNGVPLDSVTGYTVNLATGTFTLSRATIGTITCSVQGAKVSSTYYNTIANVIKTIVKNYGTTDSYRLTDSDIDSSFSTFNTANPQPVGIYINGTTNIINVCQELASSVGAQITANRDGKLVLRKIDLPTSPTISRTIDDTVIFLDTCRIESKLEVKANVKIGYCKNWTVQTNLQTGIPDSHKDYLGKEYLYIPVSDENVKKVYRIVADAPEKLTLLLTNAGGAVSTEATRLLNLYKVPRYIYSMECLPSLLTSNVGDYVTLNHNRFGLSAGKTGQIVSMSTNLDTGIVTLGVLV